MSELPPQNETETHNIPATMTPEHEQFAGRIASEPTLAAETDSQNNPSESFSDREYLADSEGPELYPITATEFDDSRTEKSSRRELSANLRSKAAKTTSYLKDRATITAGVVKDVTVMTAGTVKDVTVKTSEAVQEKAVDALDLSKIAVHGLSGAIARKKLERAGSRMERMEHKIALYGYMGEVALRGSSDIVERNSALEAMVAPRSRTVVERYMDTRLDRRREKQSLKELDLYRHEKIYGTEKDPKKIMENVRNGNFTASDTYRSGTVRRSVNHALDSSKRNGIIRDQFKNNEMTAREYRLAQLEIKANPKAFESPYLRKIRKSNERSVKNVDRSVEQPRLSKWRNMRMNRAINSIQANYLKAQKHAELSDEARNRRKLRKA